MQQIKAIKHGTAPDTTGYEHVKGRAVPSIDDIGIAGHSIGL